jgi:hypothetical protein
MTLHSTQLKMNLLVLFASMQSLVLAILEYLEIRKEQELKH